MNKILWLAPLTLLACEAAAPEAPPLKPPPPAYPAPIGPEEPPFAEYHVLEVKPGDSLSRVLARESVRAEDLDAVARTLDPLFSLRHLRPGQVLELKKDEAGRLIWLKFHASAEAVYVLYRGPDDKWRGRRAVVEVDTATVSVSGRVEASLSTAIQAAHEEPWLTLTLVDLFAWDIDFFTETRPGDRFKVIVEKRFLGGTFVHYGHVLAAEYTLAGGRSHQAFRYTFADGKVGYYTAEGQAVEKAFLKSPVKFATITSRYGMRRHPILHYRREHKGVDYGAPRGTAIWAMADGVVRFAGRAGGYGRLVDIRHRNGIRTRYAHLNGFGRGIRSGVRVHQKQVIGYVGSSGMATGPHLHFEVLINNRHTNPLRLAAPPAPPIPQEEQARFQAQIAPWVARLK